MKQPTPSKRANGGERGGSGVSGLWLFVVAGLIAGIGVALDFSAPHAAHGWADHAGAPSVIGLVCALACGLVARLLRLVLGRTERRRPPS